MIGQGTFQVPVATVFLDGSAISTGIAHAAIYQVELYAGEAIGHGTIGYPANLADNPRPKMGSAARIEVGGKTIFRGAVAVAPVEIDEGQDELQLLLADDKWLMRSRVGGMYGIGNLPDATGAEGFTDVGFDVVFNRDGKPNKDPSALMFNTGSTAVFWTLRDALAFVFQYYIDPEIITLDTGEIAHDAWSNEPSHVSLVGKNGLQMVEELAQLAGETWTLIPGASCSTYRSIRPGHGTLRKAELFLPWKGQTVASATDGHASRAGCGASIENAIDSWQCMSSAILKDATYSNLGANPLLVRKSDFKDKEYAVRFAVDVTKYGDHALGRSLSAGSAPRKWLDKLCTRLNTAASAFLAAAEIAANPALVDNERAKPMLWVSHDGAEANAKLVVGGAQIHDSRKGLVDLKNQLAIAPATPGNSPGHLAISDWSAAGVWLTIATELTEETAFTDADSEYLPVPMTGLILKPDLKPERRQDVWLPDLASADQHAVSRLATGTEEKYIDVTDRLAEAVMSAAALSPEIETPVKATLPFFPLWNVGDRLQAHGRNLGQSGNEIIDSIVFDIYENFEVAVTGTNIVASIDPEKFVRRRR